MNYEKKPGGGLRTPRPWNGACLKELYIYNGQLLVWGPVVWDSNRVPLSNNPFHTGLPETPSSPLTIGRAPKGKDRRPNIHFWVRAVSFREGKNRAKKNTCPVSFCLRNLPPKKMSCKCDVNVYMKYGEISKLKAHDLGLSSVDILVGKSSSIFLSLSLSLSPSICSG